MFDLTFYLVAVVGGVIGIYFVFRKMHEEDKAIIKKSRGDATQEFRRQVWMGGIVRHAIFALSTIAAGGGLAFVTFFLQERESNRYNEDLYYLSGALILVGIFWLVSVAIKYTKENKQWQKPLDG